MTSAFDPKTFLDFTIDTPLERRKPLPAELDYTGIVGEPDSRAWVSPTDPTKSGIALDYMIELQIPPDVVERLGYRQNTLKVKYGVMLDLTPTGGIDQSPGANGGLRKLREATDLNKPGDSFSPRKVTGRPVKVKIKHREYPVGSGELFEDIAAIAKI